MQKGLLGCILFVLLPSLVLGEENKLNAETKRKLIVGTWRRVSNEDDVVVFKSNGEWQTIYKGVVIVSGYYEITDKGLLKHEIRLRIKGFGVTLVGLHGVEVSTDNLKMMNEKTGAAFSEYQRQ